MPNRELSVLIVDDEKDIADSAREVLEHLVPNCHVVTADTCAHGLEALARCSFDAVLVDYRMPDRTGLEFIRLAHDIEPNVPIILMTAYGSMDMAMTAVNTFHVDGFLPKPIDAQRLVGAVEEAVRLAPVPDAIPLQW